MSLKVLNSIRTISLSRHICNYDVKVTLILLWYHRFLESSSKVDLRNSNDEDTTEEKFDNLLDDSELVPLLEKTMEDFLQSGNEACSKLEQVSEAYKEYTKSLQAAIQRADIGI